MNLETVKPALGSNAWVAPNAAVVGDVKLGDRSSVWYGSIVRGMIWIDSLVHMSILMLPVQYTKFESDFTILAVQGTVGG